MKRRFMTLKALCITLILIFLLSPHAGCADKHKTHSPATQQRFKDIDHWVRMFEDPERDTWQKPAEVVETMNLKTGDVVADIGAGTGYFTRRFAVAVGPAGKALGLAQSDVRFTGHAIEARVYAEDPETFIPSPGTITALTFPAEDANVRIDHALQVDTRVPPYYDPLLAKVIAWGVDRSDAVSRLTKALSDFRIEGVKTSTPLNLKILGRREFQEGNIDTNFIDTSL